MKYTPDSSFREHLPRFRKQFHVDDEEHCVLCAQMRMDPAYRHETAEEIHHRAAYAILWKKHGKRGKLQDFKDVSPYWIPISILSLIVFALSLSLHC